MKKTIITITILILIALGFIGYKNDWFSFDKGQDANIVLESYLKSMIDHNNTAVISSKIIMNDLEIGEAKVRVMAANIVDTESFDMSRMQNMYTNYLGSEYQISTSTKNIFDNLKDLKGDKLGKVYIRDLISYDKKTIDMSEDFMKKMDRVNKANSTTKDGLTITNSHPVLDESYALAKSLIEVKRKEIESLEKIY